MKMCQYLLKQQLYSLKEQLIDVLDTLTDREQRVLRLRFGLDDGRARTLEEVGRVFNVTRERIRQIEAKALRKLRHPSRSKKLKDYLEYKLTAINFFFLIKKFIKKISYY